MLCPGEPWPSKAGAEGRLLNFKQRVSSFRV